MKDEKVFGVRRDLLPAKFLGDRVVEKIELHEICRIFMNAKPEFVSRSECETDLSFKQIIPYVILQTKKGITALYSRAGSEKRLHGQWSVGIGGHVNIVDFKSSINMTILTGMFRELDEEFIERNIFDIPKFHGVINSENDVERFHLGLVFLANVTDMSLYEPGPELKDFRWETKKVVENLSILEEWSEMALELIEP